MVPTQPAVTSQAVITKPSQGVQSPVQSRDLLVQSGAGITQPVQQPVQPPLPLGMPPFHGVPPPLVGVPQPPLPIAAPDTVLDSSQGSFPLVQPPQPPLSSGFVSSGQVNIPSQPTPVGEPGFNKVKSCILLKCLQFIACNE